MEVVVHITSGDLVESFTGGGAFLFAPRDYNLALVRLLVISDVHSNLEALKACLEAAPPYDRVANLGDNIGYGASPNEVVDILRELGGLYVRGNHDRACSGLDDISNFNPIAATAALWTRSTLHAENLLWIRKLPHGPVLDPDLTGVQFVHGSPYDEDEYILNSVAAAAALGESEYLVTFFGHTHMQGGMGLRDGTNFSLRLDFPSKEKIEHMTVMLDRGAKYLLNPGSVGQPRDGDWRAAFAIFNSEEHSVSFYRVPYAVDMAQQRIISSNLPPRLATRLREGR